LRERFAIEAGADLTLSTDTVAISGITIRQTPYAHLLDAAVAPVWQARYREKQEVQRAASEERLAEQRAQLEARREEARRAEVEEEERRAERRAEREKEEEEARRAYAESLGLQFRE